MKILWASRLQMDIALDIVTWEAITREMMAQGVDMRVVVFGKDKDNRFEGYCIEVPNIKIRYLRIIAFYVLGYFYFNYHFFKMRPNIVICNVFSIFFTFPLVIFAGRMMGVKFVLDNRTLYFDYSDNHYDKFNYYLSRVAFSFVRVFCHGTMAINGFLARQVSEYVGFPLDKIAVWSSGVEENMFDSSIRAKRPDWMQDKYVVMQHGGMSYNRGLIESVEAMTHVTEPDIMLVLVGKGPAKAELEQKVEALELSEKVRLLPPVLFKDVPALISHADAALMAYPATDYWRGNNPIKLLEYMAMEKPIICRDMYTFREVLNDSPACFYLRNNDPESIARAVMACYSKRTEVKKASQAHRSIVLERYTWRQQAKKLLNYIESL